MDLGDELTGGSVLAPLESSVKQRIEQTVGMTSNVVTNAGLNVVKSFYKHLQLMTTLSGYSFEIFRGISRLFEFYTLTIFFTFSEEHR